MTVDPQGLSAENRTLIQRVLGVPSPLWGENDIDALLNAARSEGPQPPAVKVDEGLFERMMSFSEGAYLADVYLSNVGALEGLRTDILSLLGFCRNTTIS